MSDRLVKAVYAGLYGCLDVFICWRNLSRGIAQQATPTPLLGFCALYGLTTSCKSWYNDFESFLKDNGYNRIVSDPCIFKKVLNAQRHKFYIVFTSFNTFS